MLSNAQQLLGLLYREALNCRLIQGFGLANPLAESCCDKGLIVCIERTEVLWKFVGIVTPIGQYKLTNRTVHSAQIFHQWLSTCEIKVVHIGSTLCKNFETRQSDYYMIYFYQDKWVELSQCLCVPAQVVDQLEELRHAPFVASLKGTVKFGRYPKGVI